MKTTAQEPRPTGGPRPGASREFRLLWISGLLASLSAQTSSIALPLLILRETGSATQAGTIGTVAVGTSLLTMLPAGALADTVERRRLMLWCGLGGVLTAGALATAVARGSAPMLLVLLVVMASAVITGLYGSAALGMLRTVVPADQLGTASSRLQARGAAARLVGPLLGGLLFSWHSFLPFAAESVGLVASMACLAAMRTRSAPAGRRGGGFDRKELTAGLTFLWREPYLRTVLLVFGIGMNAAFGAMTFAALAVSSDGGRSGTGSGFVVSLTAAGSLVGAFLAPRVRPEEHARFLVTATCWACAGAVAVLIAFQQPVVIGLLTAVCIAFASLANIGFLTTLLLVTPSAMVGRVESAAGFLSSLVQPLGPVAAGALITVWGPSTAFGVLAVVFAVCAATVTLAPSMRHAPAAVADPGSPDVSDVSDVSVTPAAAASPAAAPAGLVEGDAA